VTRIALKLIAPAAFIAVAATAAFPDPVSRSIDTTRQGPTVRPRFQIAYKYKVQGTKAKGSEKFHTSVGQAFLSPNGASFQGQFEVSGDSRPTFALFLFAPAGTAVATDTSFSSKFNSKKIPREEALLDLDEFGFALQRLDDDIGGTNNARFKRANARFKKAPVGVNGTFQVDSLKVKGRLRERKGEYTGSYKFSAKGTVTSGPNAGKTFKVSIKAKVRKAPLLDT